jgi:hypothetical protein
MIITEAKAIIEELIDLSDAKYGYLKVGRDTLNNDILFIEKYEQLKEILGAKTIEDIDFQELPRIKDLKDIIKKISDFEAIKQNRNVRLNKATSAYKK